MFSVKIGTTNLNGNESSNNLTEEHEVLSEYNREVSTDIYYASQENNHIIAGAQTWNIFGAKEVKIDAKDQNVTTIDFVDVDINLQGSCFSVCVDVINSKRGQIETGYGHDIINVSALTNGGSFKELFTVSSGHGCDVIKFVNTENSQYTQLSIDAGTGNDIIDISGLLANTFDAELRVLDGGDGNDLLIGSEGNETLIGGNGYDLIKAGAGNDIIDAGNGSDIIYAGEGDDIIDAGNGWDFIKAGNGNDIINAGNGSDTIYAGEGDDIIDAGNGWDFIKGGDGNDTINAGNGWDTIYGGEGNDIIDGGKGVDYINAGEGNDTVVFDKYDIFTQGGEGLDAIIVTTSEANIGYNYHGFEAIIGEKDSAQDVHTLLTDGLVVALGEDNGDELSFFSDHSFISVDTEMNSELSDLISAQNIDISSLDAYQANTGEVIWTDVNLYV